LQITEYKKYVLTSLAVKLQKFKKNDMIQKSHIMSGLAKTNKSLLILLFPFLVVGYLVFISLPFPYITNSTLHIVLSYLIFLILTIYSLYVFYKKDYYSLLFFYNFVWLFSLSMALLALSSVQYNLTIDYIIFILLTIIFFNLGFLVGSTKKNKVFNSKESRDKIIYDRFLFKFSFLVMIVMCITGYAYEIKEVGFVPLVMAIEEGFFDNRAGFLSIVHYFSTSLGGFAGASLAFFFVARKSKFFYFTLFLITIVAAISLLTKNILFLTIFYFVAIMKYHERLSLKYLVTFFIVSVGFLLLSSAIRTGSYEYIKTYSRIGYHGLPIFFYWINTYFAINITHLNTYLEEGFTRTYGFGTISLFTSLFFLKGYTQEIIGEEIVHYNGLGGQINVVPMLYSYLTDYGFFAFIPMFFVGLISGYIYLRFKFKKSFFYAIMYGSFAYILALSVFGDFLNRLMVPINAFFLLVPYYMSKIKLKRGK